VVTYERQRAVNAQWQWAAGWRGAAARNNKETNYQHQQEEQNKGGIKANKLVKQR